MTPNKITGMRLRGIGRAPLYKHELKQGRKFQRYMAALRKQAREQAQYEKANREYSI